jgi:hypothetical protein
MHRRLCSSELLGEMPSITAEEQWLLFEDVCTGSVDVTRPPNHSPIPSYRCTVTM